MSSRSGCLINDIAHIVCRHCDLLGNCPQCNDPICDSCLTGFDDEPWGYMEPSDEVPEDAGCHCGWKPEPVVSMRLKTVMLSCSSTFFMTQSHRACLLACYLFCRSRLRPYAKQILALPASDCLQPLMPKPWRDPARLGSTSTGEAMQ